MAYSFINDPEPASRPRRCCVRWFRGTCCIRGPKVVTCSRHRLARDSIYLGLAKPLRMSCRMKSRLADMEQTLDLPPGYTLVALRELGDAFAHGCEIAAEAGA